MRTYGVVAVWKMFLRLGFYVVVQVCALQWEDQLGHHDPLQPCPQPGALRNPVLSIHPEIVRLSWAEGVGVEWRWGGRVGKFEVTDSHHASFSGTEW